jgi:hypothetical protein
MSVCEVCRSETTKRCSRCKQAYFCSEEHQRSGWKSHRETCSGLLAKAANSVNPSSYQVYSEQEIAQHCTRVLSFYMRPVP